MLPLRALLLALIALTPLAAQPAGESHDAPRLAASLAEAGRVWNAFLNRASLSCGIYRLSAGATDGQSPHDRDEVYYVIAGKAALQVGDQRHDATPGKVLFVAAGAEHRFVDIEEDLTLLVFFSSAIPARGGMAAGPRPTEQTPYDEHSGRGSARIFYWYADSSAGQFTIDYGRPAWNPSYVAFLQKPGGPRWRLGENHWTNLDTNIPLTIGGVDLEPGLYYLVLQHDADAGLQLVALDPQQVRSRRLDAYEANETTGGTVIPLTREDAPHSGRLQIDVTVDRSEQHRGDLTIRFGPHRLTAPVVMRPAD